MIRFPLVPCFALICATTVPARAADSYRAYSNARFGFVAQYPSNLLRPRPESANGDGRKFVSLDGTIDLTTFGARNSENRLLKEMQARAIEDWKFDKARLTYTRTGPDWFALSGYLGDDIFYEKTVLANNIFHTMIWQYPKKLKDRMDAPVTRTVRAFEARRFRAPGTRDDSTISAPKSKARSQKGY